MPRWEMSIVRSGEQVSNGKRRTVGRYQVFHDGVPVEALSGWTAETRSPGDNSQAGNNRCIVAKTYPLAIQSGEKYATIGYTSNTNPAALRRPGILVEGTHPRVGILIHPARGFLWSIGCINPATDLSQPSSTIDFIDSRNRVIALIDDLRSFLGAGFPTHGGAKIPGAFLVISE